MPWVYLRPIYLRLAKKKTSSSVCSLQFFTTSNFVHVPRKGASEMANYRKAPKLYHEGSKSKGNFYQLPHSLMNAVFQKFDGKNGNAIKLLVVMIGSAGDGSFALSEKMIENRTGMSKQSYHRTMDSLEASGYVIRENGKVILNLPLLLKDEHDDDQERHRQTEKSTHDDEIRQHDDDYNKKE